MAKTTTRPFFIPPSRQGAARVDTFSTDEVEFLKQAALFTWKEQITRKIKRILEALHEELAARLYPSAMLAPEGMDFTRWVTA